MSIHITIPGPPRPERKRSYRRGQHTVRVDTPEAADWKARAALCAREAYQGPPLEGALAVEITVAKLKPKSWPKKRNWWTTKSDLDNYCKSTFDALTGIIWRDDAQVVRLYMEKGFEAQEEVRVTVEELESQPQASGEA